MSRHRRRQALTALVLALSLAVTGCAGGQRQHGGETLPQASAPTPVRASGAAILDTAAGVIDQHGRVMAASDSFTNWASAAGSWSTATFWGQPDSSGRGSEPRSKR
ncbi:hypothetical protein [Fodinicola feengrottensis]|uniref:Uncharacterized protein n=1 Tax=Fodinicola feengrottensis TaxID=435914 RepID=A0ABN2I469_9ACTN|nr:hypothetical protein [Fodinicola feengrottensis]